MCFCAGGFGNNPVDNGPVQRYRERGSIPGFNCGRRVGGEWMLSLKLL